MTRLRAAATVAALLLLAAPASADPPPRGVGLAFFTGEVQRSTAEGTTSGVPIGLDALGRYGWLQGGFLVADQFDAHPFAVNEAATTLGVLLGPAVPLSDLLTLDALAVGGKHGWSNSTGGFGSYDRTVVASLPFVGARFGATLRGRGEVHWLGGVAFALEDDLGRRTASTTWMSSGYSSGPPSTYTRAATLGGVTYAALLRAGVEASF